MKLPKGKCSITVDVAAYTRHPNGKKTQGALELKVEKMLRDVFYAYLKLLIAQLPNAAQYELVQLDENNADLRKKK